MIAGFAKVLAASADDRRNLFVGAGTRMGSVEQNIEKDFWVCWTLDALFNGIEHGGPRLLFKGGTSLSKGYGLISRFPRTSTSPCFATTSARQRPSRS